MSDTPEHERDAAADGSGSSGASADPQTRRSGGDKGDDGSNRKDQPKKESLLKKPWVRLVLIIAAVVIVVVLIVMFVRYESRGKYQQATNDATIDANVVTVAPQVNGYVVRVFVDDNQNVKAGQPLVVSHFEMSR